MKTRNMPFSEKARTWLRRSYKLGRWTAEHSRRVVASIFIQENGRTICHYHTNSDKSSSTNDFSVQTKPGKFGHAVTGVPYEPEKCDRLNAEALQEWKDNHNSFSHLEPNPDATNPEERRKSRDITTPNPNFTLERVLEFFPVKDDRHVLHCGCLLDEVLFDYSVWKRVPLRSVSTGAREGLGSPLQPRERLFLYSMARAFNFSTDMFYSFTDDAPIPVAILSSQQWQAQADKLAEYAAKVKAAEDEKVRVAADKQREKELEAKKRTGEYVEIEELQDGDLSPVQFSDSE